jgi:hypothetical protein
VAVVVAGVLVASSVEVLALPAGGVPVSVARAAPQAAADVSEAGDVVGAQRLARREGHRVEVAGQRSESSVTFANPDGSLTSQVAAGVVRVRRGDGSWAAVDTGLVSDASGVHPRAVSGGTVFSGGGSGLLVSGVLPGGGRFGVSWPSVLPVPVLSGDTARYSGVSPGVDVVVAGRPAGFEFSVVLHARPAAGVFPLRVPVSAAGLSVGTTGAGGLLVRDGSGVVVGSGPTPVMFDARRDASGGPAAVRPVGMSVEQTASGPVLVLSPDPAFLADPQLTYPVTVDPSLRPPEVGESHGL